MFSIKDWIVNIVGTVGHLISVTAIQLCYCGVKAAIDAA